LGEKLGVEEEEQINNVEPSTTEGSLDEMKHFLFDEQDVIDVEALEQFVLNERENLESADTDDFQIDLKPMLVSKQQSV